MKVYHGSDVKIKTVDLSKCRVGTDFGHGFYVTRFLKQAEDIAVRVASWHDSIPVVTEFEFNEFAFIDGELKILRFYDYSDEWLNFVVLNRKNREKRQAHDYDIVEGPVADDKIATQVDKYIEGAISKEQFLKDLSYYPSHQICFCTMQSLQALTLQKGKIDIAIYDIGDHVVQSIMTDYGLTETEAADIYYTSKTYTQLADENTKLYLKPYQEIYRMLLSELKN